MNNIYELFYKIIENPRCIKYYEDLIGYYENSEKKELYKNFLEKIKNELSNNDS
jgi:hypothetical protein